MLLESRWGCAYIWPPSLDFCRLGGDVRRLENDIVAPGKPPG